MTLREAREDVENGCVQNASFEILEELIKILHIKNHLRSHFHVSRLTENSFFSSVGLPCSAAVSIHSPRGSDHETEALPDTTHVCDGILDLLQTGNLVVPVSSSPALATWWS